MKTPIALVLAMLAFAAGYFLGERQGHTAGAAVAERLTAIETKLADLEKARAAAPARGERPTLAPAEALKVIQVSGAPIRGNPDAPVTIVEYGDFQCPYCEKSRPTLQQILETYPKEVRLVYKHFPLSFHRDAMNAHKASLAAGEQGKFWEMHDLIFAHPRRLAPEKMREHAQALKLDMARFDADYASERVAKKIEADQAEGRRALVRGTPAFFVNGKMISGAQPFEAFKREIDAALGRKDA
jgi:protein-disulfide isomerase